MSARPFVFIRRACLCVGAFSDEAFAKLRTEPQDDAADVIARACAQFGWGSPTQARLYIASAGGATAPTQAEMDAALRDESRRLGEGAVVAAAPAAVLMDAVRTGAVFSLLQGAFYQVSLSTVYCPLATCISPPLCFLIRLAT